MISNKFLIMSLALFALILAASAQDSGEKIADRRFRWVGSNEQEQEDDVDEEVKEEEEVEEEEEPVEDADSLEEDKEEESAEEQLDSEDSEADA
ncbi:U3 small nucleolar RNA-associated protein 25-like [Drosophila hydei]|uniref:U3 small nucleolar RNA-associated protein 25-like n=1 Tax=Drosophila hydei TaxID=7224 RepID=A0A6J1LKB8_DROHY|nr:U3 small nucleolar RNA-associated protein 25-like [Drosophila hydei]